MVPCKLTVHHPPCREQTCLTVAAGSLCRGTWGRGLRAKGVFTSVSRLPREGQGEPVGCACFAGELGTPALSPHPLSPLPSEEQKLSQGLNSPNDTFTFSCVSSNNVFYSFCKKQQNLTQFR